MTTNDFRKKIVKTKNVKNLNFDYIILFSGDYLHFPLNVKMLSKLLPQCEDGEVVVPDSSFQEITSLVMSKSKEPKNFIFYWSVILIPNFFTPYYLQNYNYHAPQNVLL